MECNSPLIYVDTSFLTDEMQWLDASEHVCNLLSSHIQIMVLAEIYKIATPPENLETMKFLEVQHSDGGREIYLCFENLCIYREIRYRNKMFIVQHIPFKGNA